VVGALQIHCRDPSIVRTVTVVTNTLELARTVMRRGRRARGAWQTRRTEVEGRAPAAVVAALRAATSGVPSAEEQAWIDRIESMRRSLSASTEPLVIEDFGAGRHDEETTEQQQAAGQTTTRTLGKMTASSKPPRWAYLLFRLIRELRPETGLEMGACVGISAAYQAAALELNGTGRLLSLEGSSVLAERSTKTLQELGLDHRAAVRLGSFSDTLPGAAAELAPLDWAFVDGHHAEGPTVAYAEQLLPFLSKEAVVVFDDINWSPGMRRAWKQIQADERFSMTVDLRSVGLAVVTNTPPARRSLAISFG
jgi:predicted O-methyltransferase YrrM